MITVGELKNKLNELPEEFEIELSFVNGISGSGWMNLEKFRFENELVTDIGYSSKKVILGIEKEV